MFGNNAGPGRGYRAPQQNKASFSKPPGSSQEYYPTKQPANMLDPRARQMPPPPAPAYDSGYTYPGTRQFDYQDFGNDIRRPPSGPLPPAPPPPAPGRVMDGPGSGFTYPGNDYGQKSVNQLDPRYRGTGGGFPAPPTGRIMNGPGSGYDFGNDAFYLPHNGTGGGMPPPRLNPYVDQGGQATAGPYGPPPGGFPPPPSRPPPVSYRPGQANPIQSQSEESPEEYRQSVAAERARAAKMDAAAAAKRKKMQQDRQGATFDGYDNPVYDPMVADNENQRIYREQRATARGEKPKKTDREVQKEAYAQDRQASLARRRREEAEQADLRERRMRSNPGNDGPPPTTRTPAGQSRWR